MSERAEDAGTRTLAELSEATGVPGRTIRYYISRGLLEGPIQAGRNATYDERHLERLTAIAALQAEGLSLQEIGLRLNGAPMATLPAGAAVVRYVLGPDLAVEVSAGLPPWRLRRIQAALSEFAARVAADSNPSNRTEDFDE